MNDTVLVALIGLLAGVIGSFIAPWAKWGIEKRKLQYQSRKDVVNNVRTRPSLNRLLTIP
jgi:Na+/glutamate symporter